MVPGVEAMLLFACRLGLFLYAGVAVHALQVSASDKQCWCSSAFDKQCSYSTAIVSVSCRSVVAPRTLCWTWGWCLRGSMHGSCQRCCWGQSGKRGVAPHIEVNRDHAVV